MTMMLMIMLTVIIGMKMHEYDNDGDDGDDGDDLFFSELSIHSSKGRWASHVDGLMQPLHARSQR